MDKSVFQSMADDPIAWIKFFYPIVMTALAYIGLVNPGGWGRAAQDWIASKLETKGGAKVDQLEKRVAEMDAKFDRLLERLGPSTPPTPPTP